MRKKYLKKTYSNLYRFGDTCNIHDISNSTSKDGYELISAGNSEQGCWGCFGYQIVPLGVQQPIIYLLEVYSFVKGGKIVSVVVEHRYDINGNIINSSYQQFNDTTWVNVKSNILNKKYQLNDGNMFVPTNKENFNDTKNVSGKEITKRNKGLILDNI